MVLSAIHNAHRYSLSEKVLFVFHLLGESVTWVYLKTICPNAFIVKTPRKNPIVTFLFWSESKEIQVWLDLSLSLYGRGYI